MGGHVRLHEEHAFFGIDAAGDKQRQKFERVAAKGGRLLSDGDGVQIGDRVKTAVFVL